MTDNNEFAESKIFSQADLTYFEEGIQKEIDVLRKDLASVQARLAQREGQLAKIRQLRASNGSPSDSLDDRLNRRIGEIFVEAGEPMRLMNILNSYHQASDDTITRQELFEYLSKNKGILYEVVGERGGARWKLIERSEEREDPT